MTRTSLVARGNRLDSAWFTLAWYAVVLAVVFTTAFWVGRVLGPEPTPPVDHAPHAVARR
jgi:hypothetical protein